MGYLDARIDKIITGHKPGWEVMTCGTMHEYDERFADLCEAGKN